MNLKNKVSLISSLKPKTAFRTQLSQMVSMKERRFNEVIKEVESETLFVDLKRTGTLKFSKFHNRSVSSDFLEFDDDIFHDSSSNDETSRLLELYQDLIPVLKQIGINNFKSLFLDAQSIDENLISSTLNISLTDTKRILSLINDISVLNEFFHPSKINTKSFNYIKTAKIDLIDGLPVLGYYSLNMSKGRYTIDSGKLSALKKSSTSDEVKRIDQLIAKINIINARKNITHSLFEYLTTYQKDYLISENPLQLKFLTAKTLAQNTKVSQSSVSRIIYSRSIVTPKGFEIPVKSLLPKMKDIVTLILKNNRDNYRGSSDEKLKKVLLDKFNIKVSRRLVCKCRNEII
jgi:hypothetical protein